MKIRSLLLLAALAAGSTFAGIISYDADLSGANEVPPNVSPGTGFAVVTIDDIALTMRVQISFSGLLGTTTASHIHCCQPLGTNAGVATTTPTFAGFPLGVTSGTYDNTLDMTLASSYNPSFVTNNGGTVDSARAILFAGIAGGQSYLNVHTNIFGGGEIRGQLIATPEPGTIGLALAGLGALWVRRRRSTI
jgi:CHRD domain/PEP-CTERM motif